MKKLFTLILFVYIIFTTLNGFSQAKKMVFFEHFTNASCAPCAQQNPIFDDNILKHNNGRILHLAYHTNWPGADPMNAHNPTEVQSRVTYYGVSGVPHIKMQGNKYGGSPSGVTNSMIDNEAMMPSPVRIRVRNNYVDTLDREVEVVVYTVADIPTGSYKLRTAVVEKEKTYATAPGSNGEKFFPNIFRKFLNDASGENFVPGAVGDSVVFNFNYTLNTSVWDTSEIYIIAFLQNETTKNVLNAASNFDPDWELVPISEIYQPGTLNTTSSFSINLNNFSQQQDSFLIVLTAIHPNDWDAFYTYNTQDYNDSLYLIADAASIYDISLNVTPGASPGIGTYVLKIQSLSDTSLATQVLQFYVSHNITDIVVNSDGGWGAGGNVTAQDYEQNYLDGLTLAGNTSFASVPMQAFLTAAGLGLLDSIESIFYNASWAFPSLTDASVAIFKSFLDSGGKMFISGQDIGWETYESTSGTGITKMFYSNYMGANYVSDGNQNNNLLSIYSNDPIFGTVLSSSIIDMYGGHIYPDVISAKPFSFPVFYYNADSTKLSCVRSNSTVFKTVYLAVSLEMISNADTRKEIIKLSHDWFKGYISSTEFDNLMHAAVMKQNYPNPASNQTIIEFSGLNTDGILEIFDTKGCLIKTIEVPAATNSIAINTEELKNGIYYYRLNFSGQISDAVLKMIILK